MTSWTKYLLSALLVSVVSLIVLTPLMEQSYNRHSIKYDDNNTYITLRTIQYWGVGNQMFAIAAMVGINTARGLPWKYCLPRKMQARDMFDLGSIPYCESKDLDDPTFFNEAGHAIFTPGYKSVPVDNDLVLSGYFQSWKYFKDVNVNDTLRLKDNIVQVAKYRIVQLVEAHLNCSYCVHNVTLVGVHIRRGDYLSDLSISLGYKIAPMSYIYRAIDHMTNFLDDRLHVFIVSSDDIEWCQKQLINITNIVFLTKKSDPLHSLTLPRDIGTDFAVLSLCQHSIMTVGTFGWWGAYLAGGHVVYYKDDVRMFSKLWNNSHHEDYFPPRWVGLS
ncbi:hypothetical protein CAPTEDRAFT_192469 [Capitella teleta]|uniref:L-Fucosyltransferase n=1 Tax=Capitella teleta TaxID=283909 RepID=R7U988_CAPTE|nr:hypothetical protein CAPTEDRAFT_192469 [Capitella teleta]|eukprot:ELU00373.1 hypothetical protein CAPTEDRAFT_192469 [Capitella teleta]